MQLTLKGKILTPIVTKKTLFEVEGCRAVILAPKRRFITKSHKIRRIYPFSFTGYLGTIQLTYHCHSFPEAQAKLQDLISIEYIGRFWREGLGHVEWVDGKIGPRSKLSTKKPQRRVKIRKGLPHHFPPHIQTLLRYAMLHDFVHTPRHRSKIYVEPDLAEIEYLRQHHAHTDDLFIQNFQRYDRIAASMTRTIRSPRTNRYTWESRCTVDFQCLATDIEQHEQNISKLYLYIYHSNELAQLNESLQYGHSSLRIHLLLIANLIVQDFLRGKL